MATLDEALDIVEQLPEDQQQLLFEILRKRAIEQRRNEIAVEAAEAIQEYRSGSLKPLTADEAIDELRRSLQKIDR